MAIALAVCACSTQPSGPEPPPEGNLCASLDCVPCALGDRCAEAGELIEGTCCARGDNIERLGQGGGSEVVDIESDGTYAVLCGGFGATINDVSDPRRPVSLGSVGGRCQRAAFGPVLSDGTRVFYLAHHGDSWVSQPFLRTFHISPSQQIGQVDADLSPGVLFEGVAYQDGFLFVAAHELGLRIYEVDAATGVPALRAELSGFANAWKLVPDGDALYVADADAGLRVVDISDPLAPSIAATVETSGAARDVDAHGGRVYVGMGGSGIDVFDATDPFSLAPVGTIDARGSVQGVSANDSIIAAAAWNHIAVYDVDTLSILGTERTRRSPSFEQDLGISVVGDVLFVGEWEGLHVFEYHQGLVASDIWVEDDLFSFANDSTGARAVIVENLGALDLEISEVSVDDPAFSVIGGQGSVIGWGDQEFFEVQFEPPGPADGQSIIAIHTNDPDAAHSPLEIPLVTLAGDRLDVGDTLTNDFAFLDPTGSNQLSQLEGNVVVIAYFALF